ncbi:cytochrome c biogenesis protein transmembrane region [Desulfitobacterium hafniense DCB-2]|uniref:Cytochrome c biogenesis protein transmembrane region n=1 Tax=Desulfitobacterium hafniense (strain DSM 10664 / DCB-2) TaxID=272564 RepID=B8FRB8_DESHD|nr:cytochrome c biogenesis protein CcdA [Desulfitobacterium hafniense]ACL20033.1 cytochrome c biogenesis protein transmembrane region [Desulfitobacterium hafniense DCB-2]
MDSLAHSLMLGMENGSWWLMGSMFMGGIVLSINPCMGAMIPLVIGGARQEGYSRVIQFILGFTLTLMLIGALAAQVGILFRLPGMYWAIFLGVLYLVAGAILLGFRFPVKVSGFYVTRKNGPLRHIYQKGLSPWVLGSFFALAPSPCTTPVILMMSGTAMASGHMIYSSLALGAFGLGHSLLLAMAFVPGVRRLFKMNRWTLQLRPVIGILLILLSGYILVTQPGFEQAMSGHQHQH